MMTDVTKNIIISVCTLVTRSKNARIPATHMPLDLA
jgi:hypothetical protein